MVGLPSADRSRRSRAEYSEKLTSTAEFLVLCARAQRTPSGERRLVELYRQLGTTACLRAAEQNQVVPLVASALVQLGGLPDADFWSKRLSANSDRVSRLLETLVTVFAALEDVGARPAVIEGGGTLLGTELPLGAYCARDFDVLVHPDAWEEVPLVMQSLGFEAADRRGRPTTRVEFGRVGRAGEQQWIEIGCAAFDRMWVPLSVSDRASTWIERRVSSSKFPDVRVLHPSDAIVVGAMHTSMHSFVRAPGLRLYLDIDRPVHDSPPDWDEVLSEARALNGERRCLISLAIARSILGTPVPSSVTASLFKDERRWAAISSLLSRNGVIADGKTKLGALETILLDLLISTDGPVRWTTNVLVPPYEWLATHFDRDGGTRRHYSSLQWARLRAAVARWRPE